MKLEICCADADSVRAALEGGADRIELCSALEIGGLTPSVGLIAEAVAMMGGERVNVLLRPRGGDFVYSDLDFKIMERDIREAVSLGAGGVVVGALTVAGMPDIEWLRPLRREFPEVTFTFHRAFDLVADPFAALQELIEAGFDRILTSGLAPDALAGVEMIGSLVEEAKGRIEIMAGCGVTPQNIREIVRLSGVKDIHASAKEMIKSVSLSSGRGVSMGTAESDDGCRFATSAAIVKQLKALL